MRLWPTSLGAKGALFFAAVVLLFFATPYSNLFFLLTSFLAVLGVAGGLGTIRNAQLLGATLVAVEPAAAGGTHEATLRMAVRKGRRAFAVRVFADVAGTRSLIAEVPFADDGTLVNARFEGLPRGVHRVTALRLRTRYPFGILTAERKVRADAEVVAYPAPTPAEQAPMHARAGAGQMPPSGDEESLAGLREWRSGDSLRNVHWKATARAGHPIVKELERLGGDGQDLVLDRRMTGDELEHALSMAARHVFDAAETRQALRLRSQDADLCLDQNRPQTAPLLRWLAQANALPADAPPPPSGSQRCKAITGRVQKEAARV